MAIALRAVSALGTGTTSVTVNQPTGKATGDVMLACIIDKATVSTATTAPTGWTSLLVAGAAGGRIQIFYAVVGLNGLTGTSWSWTGLTTTATGVMIGYSGVHNGTPIDATGTVRSNASGTTGTTTMTTATNLAQVVAFFASLANGATWSAEAVATSPTLTEQFDSANGTAMSIAIADGNKATAGSTGASSATMSANAANGGALVTLRPDVVGLSVSKDVNYVVLAPPIGLSVSKDINYVVLGNTNVNAPIWPTFLMSDGTVGIAYYQGWDLTPAAPPTTYSVLSGSLPTGLSLASPSGDQGNISGTPTVAGVYSFTLRATNTFGHADQAFTITINANPVSAGGAFTFVM